MEVTRPFETIDRGGRERARLLRARDARILKVCPNALERNTLDDAVVLWNRWKRPGCGPSLSKWSASGSSFEAKCYKKAGELRRRQEVYCDRDISKLVLIFTSDLVTVTLEPSFTTDILLLL